MRGNSCRICLLSDESRLVELFCAWDGDSRAMKLNFCAGIEVRRGDKLPQKICSDCLQKVEAACEIKEKCIETDQLLREQIKPDPDECDEVDIKVEANPSDWFVSFGTDTTDQLPPPIAPKCGAYSDEETEWPEAPVEVTTSSYNAPPKVKNVPKRERIIPKFQPVREESPQNSAKRKPRSEDYTCVFCQKVFPKIIEKTKHMKADHADELLCRICNKKRGSVIATENCMKDHIFGYNYLCQICAKPFRWKRQLHEHIAGVHSIMPESEMCSCDLCGTKLKYKYNIRRHMRTVHMNHKIPCPYDTCPDRFYTTRNSLNIHLYRHHNVPAPVRCSACGGGFSNTSELNAHLKRCNGNHTVRIKQNISLKTFYDEVNGMLQCNLCPKAFPTKKHFADHFQGYHRDNKTCAICEKTFSSFMAYRKHYKVVHEKIRKFHCDHPGCGKNFSTKGILISHRNTHTGEKPFACNLCSFRTGDLPTLSKHRKKMHTQPEHLVQPVLMHPHLVD